MYIRGIYHYYEDVYFCVDSDDVPEYWGVFLDEKEKYPFNWKVAFKDKDAAEAFCMNPENKL